MAKAIVRNFLIEGEVEDGAGSVVSSAACHSVSKHRVRLTNLSTLTYDIELTQALPDALPPRPFSYSGSGASATGWTLMWPSLGGPKFVEAKIDLDLHGPPARNARLWTQAIRFRLATGLPPALGGLYTTISTVPMPVDVRLTVT